MTKPVDEKSSTGFLGELELRGFGERSFNLNFPFLLQVEQPSSKHLRVTNSQQIEKQLNRNTMRAFRGA
jgi:hypothetical protein